jgi:hypothetical protein
VGLWIYLSFIYFGGAGDRTQGLMPQSHTPNPLLCFLNLQFPEAYCVLLCVLIAVHTLL